MRRFKRPPEVVSPDPDECEKSTEFKITDLISSGVAEGFDDHSTAAAPETNGAAMLVPLLNG